MGFITPEDHILIMDFDEYDGSSLYGPEMTEDDIKQLYDCGIRTAVKYVQWHCIEPQKGVYDWSQLDRQVDKWTRNGVKILLNTPMTTVQWAPDNWYAKNRYGAIFKSSFSAFNMEAQDYQLGFLRTIMKRYPQDMVCAFNGQITQGETVYHNEPAYYDDCAKEDFVKVYGVIGPQFDNPNNPEIDKWLHDAYISMLLKQQMVLAETPHKEIWTALHPVLRMQANLQCNGNKYYYDIFQAYRWKMPDSQIYQILYTYWPHGNRCWQQAREDATIFNIKVFVGSEYCAGLDQNTDAMMQQGYLSGFITSPIHPFTKIPRMEQCLFDSIRNSIKKITGA